MVVTRFKNLDILVSQTELALDFTKSVAYQSTNRPKSCRVVPSLSFPYKSKRSRLSCLCFNIPQHSIISRLGRYYVIFSIFSISLQSLDTCCGIYIVLRTLCNSANRSAWIRRYVKLPEVYDTTSYCRVYQSDFPLSEWALGINFERFLNLV
jgi:hypothetical protein